MATKEALKRERLEVRTAIARLRAVEAAMADYHHAIDRLDRDQNGDEAASRAIDAIEVALKIEIADDASAALAEPRMNWSADREPSPWNGRKPSDTGVVSVADSIEEALRQGFNYGAEQQRKAIANGIRKTVERVPMSDEVKAAILDLAVGIELSELLQLETEMKLDEPKAG